MILPTLLIFSEGAVSELKHILQAKQFVFVLLNMSILFANSRIESENESENDSENELQPPKCWSLNYQPVAKRTDTAVDFAGGASLSDLQGSDDMVSRLHFCNILGPLCRFHPCTTIDT